MIILVEVKMRSGNKSNLVKMYKVLWDEKLIGQQFQHLFENSINNFISIKKKKNNSICFSNSSFNISKRTKIWDKWNGKKSL